MTARQVITSALQRINMLAEHETPSGQKAARAMRELNMMLKGWQKHENLWRLSEGVVTLTASTASYALSPVPHRVVSARYRSAGGIDLPMREMVRNEYYDLPLKTSTGIPTQYYIDYQRSAVTMYVWQLLTSVSTETVQYTYQRKFEDVDALDNDIDVKPEHLEVVDFNLAARLADGYGRTGAHIDRIIARAQMLLDEALDDDREDFIQFIPDYR